MGSVATQYRINPIHSASANANDARIYFREDPTKCSRPRHFGANAPGLFCQRSKRDLRARLVPRALLIERRKPAFNPGQRLPNDVLLAIMAARLPDHHAVARRRASRKAAPARRAICRASVQKESRTCPGLTAASLSAESCSG